MIRAIHLHARWRSARLRSAVLAAAMLLPAAVLAGDRSDLPPDAAAVAAINAHPAVRAAEAGLLLGEAQHRQIAAGPHEFVVRVESQRRRDLPGATDYQEQALGLERTLRLPGKRALDRALAESALEQARLSHGDALHETARLLLKSWFDWRRTAAAAADWQAHVDLLDQQHRAALRRVEAGDAARLEAGLAHAQLTQAQAQRDQTRVQVMLAADQLTRQFPGLPLPESMPTVPPAAPEAATVADGWREAMVNGNHELALARAAVRRQQRAAQRADAERMPDPTFGVRLGRERDGQERIVGLQLSLPLPGAARQGAARAAQAEMAMAAARQAETEARIAGDAERTLIQADARYRQWRQLAEVAAEMEDNARLLDKAWRLGEGQFAELQIARRQAIETRLAATQASLDASEAHYRLLLDAHQLWPLDSHDNDNAPYRP